MNKAAIQAELETILRNLVQSGYRCYSTTKGAWGYIITPSDNVLSIQRDTYEFRGWTFSLAYVPGGNGSGCMCLEEPVQTVTAETVRQAESEGLSFAKSFGAKLYASSSAWHKNYWSKDCLQEIL